MKYEKIEKSIYSRPEISRHLRPQPAGLIIIGVGIVCGSLYAVVHNAPLRSMLLMAAGTGAFTLVLMLCYYLFGDSRRPYYKPAHALLEPEYIYYSAASKDTLLDAMTRGDEVALQHVKKNTIPELVLVRFSNDDNSVVFQQLQQPHGRISEAMSDVVSNVRQ